MPDAAGQLEAVGEQQHGVVFARTMRCGRSVREARLKRGLVGLVPRPREALDALGGGAQQRQGGRVEPRIGQDDPRPWHAGRRQTLHQTLDLLGAVRRDEQNVRLAGECLHHAGHARLLRGQHDDVHVGVRIAELPGEEAEPREERVARDVEGGEQGDPLGVVLCGEADEQLGLRDVGLARAPDLALAPIGAQEVVRGRGAGDERLVALDEGVRHRGERLGAGRGDHRDMFVVGGERQAGGRQVRERRPRIHVVERERPARDAARRVHLRDGPIQVRQGGRLGAILQDRPEKGDPKRLGVGRRSLMIGAASRGEQEDGDRQERCTWRLRKVAVRHNVRMSRRAARRSTPWPRTDSPDRRSWSLRRSACTSWSGSC